jgi:DNA polymerase-3 subunit beta
LFFVIGKRLLTTRRLVGTFPNYEAVLPRDHNNAVVIGRDELCSAIQRVAQFSDERSNAIRLRFEKNELKLYCSTAEAGESEDLIPINYAGEPVVMGFNSHYLLDFLKVVGAEQVKLAFKDSHTASELRPQDPALGEYTYRYVVMPVRI